MEETNALAECLIADIQWPIIARRGSRGGGGGGARDGLIIRTLRERARYRPDIPVAGELENLI